MPPRFLDPPLQRLSADGGLTPVQGGGAPWRRPVVLLARELCSFECFQPAGRAATLPAARLYARANAPYLHPGVLVRRSGAGYAIWWWDAERLAAALAAASSDAPSAAAPETLAQPAAEGWRVVRLASGFELQCWRGRALIASAWRREPPDGADWAAFARQIRDPPSPAPASPPAPETLPVSGDVALGQGLELTGASAAPLAAGVAAVLLAVAAAFWAGQALHLSSLADGLESQAAAEHALAAPPPADAAAEQRLAALRALAARPDPIAGLAAAMEVLKAHGVAVKSFGIDGGVVTVTAPYTALDKIDQITADLAATDAFSDVRPLPDSVAGAIRIQLTMKGGTAVVAPG
jgi:hypothetical protein